MAGEQPSGGAGDGAGGPLAYAAFGACSAIWGSTFLVISIGNDSLPPVWAATLRLGLAAVILTALARATGQRLPRGAALGASALYGLFGFGVNFPVLYWAEKTVPSGLTGVLYATIPLSTTFFARAFGLETLDRLKVAGAVVALGGVAIIFSSQLTGGIPIVALSALLIGASAASLASVMLKRGPRQPSFGANAVGAVVGFVICLVVSLAVGEPRVIPRSPGQLFPILYLTLAGSVGAYVLMAWLVNRWKVTSISFIAVIIPVIALVLGWLVRHERLQAASAVGAALVICGVALGLQADRRLRHAPHPLDEARKQR